MTMVCAVLAGGSSSRFGSPKAFAELGGQTLVERAVTTARAAGLDPVVVARDESHLPASLGANVVRDAPGKPHPLQGIATVLTQGHPAVVLACDMPLVPAPLLAWLAAIEDSLAVTEFGGRLQPLLGRYEPSLAPELAAAADRGEAATEAVLVLGARRIGEDELRRFGDPATLGFNINRPEDLAEAERLLTSRGG
jgi:molybdenum cofactor guanylyltransferase